MIPFDLTIAGRGAVTPAGIGIEALRAGKLSPLSAEELGRPGHAWPVLRVNLKDAAFDRWQREPRLRRASPITYFLVEAAAQALGPATPEERAQTGLIVAYSAGCLVYSRRFFEQIVRQGQRAAGPALFPETVFNSPVSHLATVLGLNGAAYALVGDEGAWASALITAAVWLKQRRVRQVLVLGAEEFDPLVLDAYRSARWLKRGGDGFLTSEGAAGMLLRPDDGVGGPLISRVHGGVIYRTRREATLAAGQMLGEVDPALPLLATARRNWLASVEAKALEGRTLVPELPYLGEAFLASAAWRTLQALDLLTPFLPKLAMPLWGLNHQFGLVELTSAK